MSTAKADKVDFKVPSRNIIVTRKKSGLLKQTKPKPKKPEPRQQPAKRNVRKKTKTDEYHPSKPKRKLSPKKVTLKPKDKFETILTLDSYSKRKSKTPRKQDLNSEVIIEDDDEMATDDLCIDDLSMAEVIRIKENTEGLSNEDLMEILTCPSPVWWEDPPNEFYEEEAIGVSKPSNSDKVKASTSNNETKGKKSLEKSMIALKRSLSKENKTLDIPTKENVEQTLIVPAISIEKRDQSFLKKRSTLENLLNHLKNDDKQDVTILNNADRDVAIMKNVDKDVTILKNTDKDVTILKNTDKDVTILKNVAKDVVISKNIEQDVTISKIFEKSTIVEPSTSKIHENPKSSEIFSGMAMEVLDDLENLDIPMVKNSGNELLELTECVVLDSHEIEGTTNNTFLGSGKDTHTIDPLNVQNVVNKKIEQQKKNKGTILIKKNTMRKIKPSNFIKLPNGTKKLSEMSQYLPILANIKSKNDIRSPLAIDLAGISKNTNFTMSNVKLVTGTDMEKRNVIQKNAVNIQVSSEAAMKTKENGILKGVLSSNENEQSKLGSIKQKIKDAYMKFLRDSRSKNHSETEISKNTPKIGKNLQEKNTDSPAIEKDDVSTKNEKPKLPTADENNQLQITIASMVTTNTEICNNLLKIEKTYENETNNIKTTNDTALKNPNIDNSDKEPTFKQSKRKATDIDKMDVDISVYTDICKTKTKKTDTDNHRNDKLSEIYRILNEYASRKQITKQIINICNACKLKLFNPMIISDQNRVKYCFKCSSIFDSDDCKYCMLGTNTIQIKNPYNCDQCKYLCCCVENLKKHQKLHTIIGNGMAE